MYNLTVIIPTYNEAQNLEELLPLVAWANEVIVVDSFSTDKTVEVAVKQGAKILKRKYQNSANQKNWAIPKAQNEWVLIIDADERPTEALIKEIQKKIENPEDKVAFWIKRDNFFMGKAIRYSGWQGDAVIRLFKRDDCRYEDKAVHAEILTQGAVGWLEARLKHYTYKSISHFIEKMERYAAWSAEDYAQKTKRITFYHLRIKPAFRFFKHYILKQGFRDGQVGFIVCKILAWGVFMRYVMLKEQRNKRNL